MYSWYKFRADDPLKIKYIRDHANGNPGSYFIYEQTNKGVLDYAVKIIESTLTDINRLSAEKIVNINQIEKLDKWKQGRQ